MIYLDSNATTQIDPRVVEAMLPFLTEHYANPSASYRAARHVRQAVDHAREQVAALIGCEPGELIFMSSGTEANNAALFSALTLHTPHRRHLVSAKTEHSAVLEVARRWMEEGNPTTFLDVDEGGTVHPASWSRCVQPGQTAVVSVMWVNNETGTIQPIEEIVKFVHDRGVLFHTDAVQAVGKLPISLRDLPVDYLSLAGHKFHAPKGIGALYVSKRVRFKPWMLGGGQEMGRRSGTENVPHIVAIGKAAELMREELATGGDAKVREMRDAFEHQVRTALPETVVNSITANRLGTTSSLTFPGIDAPGLLILLDERGVACSAGSACHTGALHPSHVLEAMGYNAQHASSTLRFSWSRLNTMEETQQAADLVIQCVHKMRELGAGDGDVVIRG
jgi:cysteine desulfurase